MVGLSTHVYALRPLLRHLGADRQYTVLIRRSAAKGWPNGLRISLQHAGLVNRAPRATSTACPGCERECFMNVQSPPRPGKARRALFIDCDKEEDYGRIPVDADDLSQWCLSRLNVVRFAARELDFEPPSLSRSQTKCRLGMIRAAKGHRTVTIEFADTVMLTVGSAQRELCEFLTWDGQKVGLDVSEIELLAVQYAEESTIQSRYQASTVAREARKRETQKRDERILRRAKHLRRLHREWTMIRIAQEIVREIPNWGLGKAILVGRVQRILSGKI